MSDKTVSFKVARLAKEKGFRIPTPHCFKHDSGEKYEIDLFSYLCGSDGYLNEIYKIEKESRSFELHFISDESEAFFDYNQDLRRLLVKYYNGEEFMDDPKSLNMNIDSYTYGKWSDEESEEMKFKLPNYNDGDFDWCVYCDTISAPTQSVLAEWLRDVHGIFVTPDTDLTLSWIYKIIGLHPQASYTGDFITSSFVYQTYEDAFNNGLYKALKLIP